MIPALRLRKPEGRDSVIRLEYIIVSSKETVDRSRMPRHIAVIMDGNGRWAKKRGLPRVLGHRAGARRVKEIVQACSDLGIEVLTLYAFSTENWVRPEKEVKGLMVLLEQYLKREVAVMMKNNVRFRTIGDIAKLPKAVQQQIEKTVRATGDNTGLTMVLALNYGGRHEIIRAANRLLAEGVKVIDESLLDGRLDTAGLPDPDLLIRTSGELRLSNFLLWQLAYSEIYVTPVLWPDFSPERLEEAISDYQRRDRRFGGVADTTTSRPGR